MHYCIHLLKQPYEVGTVNIFPYQIRPRETDCFESGKIGSKEANHKHIHQSYLPKEQSGFLPLPKESLNNSNVSEHKEKEVNFREAWKV